MKSIKESGDFFVYSACYSNPNDVCFSENNYLEWDGIPVFQLKPEGDFIERFIEKTKPDIVITQSFDAPRIVEAAKKNGAKTILGTHFWRNICEVDHQFINMLTRDICSLKILKDNHKVFYNSDHVYVNSKFMQLAVKRFTGFDCQNIIHPIIDFKKVIIENNSKEYITLINPDEGKGGFIFIELAKRLKSLNFLCVGLGNTFHHQNKIINNELSLLKNVKIIESEKEMKNIYNKTKILLVPSLVDETFSMVALEAMFNGIPVLASNYGNLPYLIEGGGFNLPTDDISIWEKAIDSLNHDNDFYNYISKNAIETSKKYMPEEEIKKFMKLINLCLENK